MSSEDEEEWRKRSALDFLARHEDTAIQNSFQTAPGYCQMDLSTVRAEIKAWERSFRAEHGRAPTYDDAKTLAIGT